MKKFKRIFMIVTDSLGIGSDSRAKEFKSENANTLYHVSKTDLLEIPTWIKLGIGEICKLKNYKPIKKQLAYMAKIEVLSNAKDSVSGHWEMMGIKVETPFPVFNEKGFPLELIKELSKAFDNRKIIGNKSFGGKEIIGELALKEKNENNIIVYTSADSVLQICGHEKWMSIDKLREYGKKARQICNSRPEWKVGRIIIRPYKGEENNYIRTHNRYDFTVQTTKTTLLENLKNANVKTTGIGKINDMFSNKGIVENIKTLNDEDGLNQIIKIMEKETENHFIFANIDNFDSKFGHRRDVIGYAKNINMFDKKLNILINKLKKDDLLIIVSDHGNDPTYTGFNHTREYVPATIYAKDFQNPKTFHKVIYGLGTLGNIIAKNFNVKLTDTGEDITKEII